MTHSNLGTWHLALGHLVHLVPCPRILPVPVSYPVSCTLLYQACFTNLTSSGTAAVVTSPPISEGAHVCEARSTGMLMGCRFPRTFRTTTSDLKYASSPTGYRVSCIFTCFGVLEWYRPEECAIPARPWPCLPHGLVRYHSV